MATSGQSNDVPGHPDVTEDGGETCIHCKSKLNKGARFCTTCELYQRDIFKAKSGIGYLTLVNAALATIVLVVNLIIIVVPDSDFVANSKIEVTTRRCYRDYAEVGVANRGRRFASLTEGSVVATGFPGEPETLDLLIPANQGVVEAKSADVLKLWFLNSGGSKDGFRPPPKTGACHYDIGISYQDFKPRRTLRVPPRIGYFGFSLWKEPAQSQLTAKCECAPLMYDKAMEEIEEAKDKEKSAEDKKS